MSARLTLVSLLILDALILFYQTSELSISYRETLLLNNPDTILSFIIHSSLNFFGQNDYALRLPIIIFHLLSMVLLYSISKEYLKDNRNRMWLIFIFMFLPGVMSSAIVISNASLVIFGLFLFMFVHQKLHKNYLYALLFFYSIIIQDFVYLFFALILYSIYIKDKRFMIANFLFSTISIYIYGFVIKGVPSGHFLDILGIYSAVFSPIVFIYIFYVLYRKYLQRDMDIIWFISSFVLAYTIILSFRQKIYIEHFAPYVILALPLAAKTFYSSYKIRLRIFRKNYRNIFIVALFFLALHSIVVFCNKQLYLVLDNPKKHFAYDMHIAKELALILKENNINCINSNKKMQARLEFYGITSCNTYNLDEHNLNISPYYNVKISYNNKVVFNKHVTKINTN